MRIALVLVCALSSTAVAESIERRLHSDNVVANTHLRGDWKQFVESYHPNYIADDDPATAWVEGSAGSGAGEWVRLPVSDLSDTTRVRLRIRNGCQRSRATYRAHPRARRIAIRLLPAQATHTFDLADRTGWQEVSITQEPGDLEQVELTVLDVYAGSQREDLCISDVQVFATSTEEDAPYRERGRREKLQQWRTARRAAGLMYRASGDRLPIYSAYTTRAIEGKLETKDAWKLDGMVAIAMKDSAFAEQWKDALVIAKAVTANLDALAPASVAPRSRIKLVAVDGTHITQVRELFRGVHGTGFRLPMLGTVAALFAPQLAATPRKRGPTIAQFEEQRDLCRDTFWAARKESKEGAPAQLTALVVGRCARVQVRQGWRNARVLEMIVYDASGRAVLVVGSEYIGGYRWSTDSGKPMIVGARSLLPYREQIIEAAAVR